MTDFDPKSDKPKNPTILDVARLAGVSTATVSRVLSDYGSINEVTRIRVNEAVRELKYQKNRNASNLRKNKISKIGVVITDIQNPFFGTVVRGIEKVTVEWDYTIILGNSDENPDQEKKLITMLLEEGVAGIILVPTNADCKPYTTLFSSNTPCVVIDRRIKNCQVDSVTVNGYAGSVAAIEHLIQKGHQRIAFIGGMPHLSVMSEREQGYMDTLAKHGLPLLDIYVKHGNNRQDGGYSEMRNLLTLENPPTAVLIANNLMTLGGLTAIHESRISIPDEIALIGFDDMDWAPSLQPPLSVISQPAFGMGERAAKLLLERIREPDLAPRKVILETELILRKSS